jgi:hypothetical protein
MAVELYAGTIADWEISNSMAREIEDALAALLGPLPAAPAKAVADRRKLFIAIANGVINHLKEKQEAFVITYNRDGVGNAVTTPVIQVKDGI